MKMRYVHTNIIAQDWKRVSLFYQNVFGCKPVSPQRDLKGSNNLRGINSIGLAHLAFEVDDVEAILEKIKKEGGGQVGELVKKEYPNHVTATFVYAKDIEGNIIELQSWEKLEQKLIAPCGMNCGLCISYLAMKNDLKNKGFSKKYCPGCLPRGKNCTYMKAHCNLVGKGLVRFCYECGDFPCKRLKALNERYRMKYHMSMIENLEFIKEYGMEMFLKEEEAKWRCPDCGAVICCHNGLCLNCNLDRLHQNKKYRWDEE